MSSANIIPKHQGTVCLLKCEIWYIGSPTINSNTKMVHNIVRYKNKGLKRLKISLIILYKFFWFKKHQNLKKKRPPQKKERKEK